MALFAESTIVARAERGFHPSIASALAEVNTCFRPGSGTTNFIWRLNSAMIRSTKSGIALVRTFFGRFPSADRKKFATSAIHTQSLAAMNRCPAASGEVMARRCRSTTSRISTTQNPMRGEPPSAGCRCPSASGRDLGPACSRGVQCHDQYALKRRLGRFDKTSNFRLGHDLPQVQHLLRVGRLGGAPAALEHLDIQKRNATSRCATVFGAGFQVRNIAAWSCRICSRLS